MKLDQHYVDPRLVEMYDIENTRGALDHGSIPSAFQLLVTRATHDSWVGMAAIYPGRLWRTCLVACTTTDVTYVPDFADPMDVKITGPSKSSSPTPTITSNGGSDSAG